MEWEKPEDAEEWQAALVVILLVTAGIAVPVVGGVMFLLLGAPTWILAASVLLILAATTWLVFTPETELDEDDDDDEFRWVRVRPRGAAGWLKFAGMTFCAWVGLSVLVNFLILDLVFGVGESTRGIVAFALLPFAILIEMYDVVEIEPAADN